jgi:hypothetical protein
MGEWGMQSSTHSFILQHWIVEVSGQCHASARGEFSGTYWLGGSVSLVSLETVAKRKIARSQTVNNPDRSQLYYTAYTGRTQIFGKSNSHCKIQKLLKGDVKEVPP